MFPVPFRSVLLRVACDRELIERPNVSELCRRVAAAYCTDHQENLSAHSLRNNFDNPSPEALEQVEAELQRWLRYTPNLKRLQKY